MPFRTLALAAVLLLGTSATAASGDAQALDLLDNFAKAWNRHDLNALMSMMSDDCVFEASGGPEQAGKRHVGREAVRKAYQEVFDTYPDGKWENATHLIHGNLGISRWTFRGTMRDGKRVEVNGVDFLTIRNGKIAIKDSYRKNRPAF
jgi:steroid delta-isomerase-like uncharacterized protein